MAEILINGNNNKYIERRCLLASFAVILFLFVATYLAFYQRPKPNFLFHGSAVDYILQITATMLFFAICFVAHLILRRLIPSSDPLLFPLVILLTGIGLVILYRLGPDIARLRGNPSFFKLAIRQYIWVCIGLIAMLFTVKFSTDEVFLELRQRKYAYVLLSAILIFLTGLFGKEINGMRLWIGFGPLTIQSVEIVKVLIVFFLAGYFTDKALFMRYRRIWKLKAPTLKSITPFCIMWVLAILPVFMQKDLGPTFLLFAVFLAMFYVGSSALWLLVTGFVAVITAGVVFYYLNWPSMVHTRVDMWLSPFTTSESLTQSLWAISSGGLFGNGLGKGMPEYIPVVQSDFNFSAICEELGFIGGASVIIAYLAIMIRGLKIALNCDDQYKKLLMTGITTLIAVQTLTIIGGVTGSIPLTGITLPFISYGGSSIVINFILLGLMLRISQGKRRNNQ